MNDDDRLLTITEVANLLGVSVATVRWWLHEGTAPDYFKVGRHVKFHSTDVDRWLEARRHPSSTVHAAPRVVGREGHNVPSRPGRRAHGGEH